MVITEIYVGTVVFTVRTAAFYFGDLRVEKGSGGELQNNAGK